MFQALKANLHFLGTNMRTSAKGTSWDFHTYACLRLQHDACGKKTTFLILSLFSCWMCSHHYTDVFRQSLQLSRAISGEENSGGRKV